MNALTRKVITVITLSIVAVGLVTNFNANMAPAQPAEASKPAPTYLTPASVGSMASVPLQLQQYPVEVLMSSLGVKARVGDRM